MSRKRTHSIDTSDIAEGLTGLKAGDQVLLSGEIFTARDQAHMRICRAFEKGEAPGFDPENKVIYYCGPVFTRAGRINACGPTTSGRMDRFTPCMLEHGLMGMIGKGRRSETVKQAIKKGGAAYFLAPGGAGAYLSKRVVSSSTVAFKDLGPEAVYLLTVRDLPLIVGIDPGGNDIYERS